MRRTTSGYGLLLLSVVGCGGGSAATGELGRVTYALHSDFRNESPDLTAVSIVTGHPQLILTALTEQGEKDTDRPEQIVHHIRPDEDVEYSTDTEEEDIGDLNVTVMNPGVYTLSSELDGDVFDYLDLRWETPDDIERITWVREPNGGEFVASSAETPTVAEGTQIALLPIPLAGSERLAGSYTVELSAEPAWAVVQSFDTLGIYEQNVYGAANPMSVYFIEPGEVTVTLRDPVHDLQIQQTFVVEPIETGLAQ